MLNKKKKQKEENNIFNNIATIEDRILPDVLEEKADYLYLGYNKYSRTFVVTIYPEQTWLGWLEELVYLGNVTISAKIETSSNASVINQLTKKLVQSQAEYANYMRQGNIAHTPVLEKEIIDLEGLRNLIQRNEDKLFFVTIFISITCESLEKLNEKSKVLEAEMNKKTAMVRNLIFKQVDGLKMMLPIGEYTMSGFERNMVSGGVATLMPITNPNVSHNKGVYLGRNYYTNAPIYLNTFIGPPNLPNPHIFICGTSGAGKSVSLKLMAERNIVTYNCSAFFIDVEGEYAKLVQKLGGKTIKIRQGESTGINPFELEKDYKGNKEFLNIMDKVADIRALLSTIARNYMGRTLNGTEITEIEIVVNQLYAERGINDDINSIYERNKGKLNNGKYVVGKVKKKMPTLSDFQKKLDERGKCKELAEILIPFLKGNSLGIFDCESTIFSNEDIISFDMSEIKDEFTKLYSSFVILTWVWQKFILKNREKKKLIVCDEAWLFLKYKESADFLATVARRGRKYNTPLLIGSQFIDEFINCEERQNNNKYMFYKILISTKYRKCREY